jgi:hypothetical protein
MQTISIEQLAKVLGGADDGGAAAAAPAAAAGGMGGMGGFMSMLPGLMQGVSGIISAAKSGGSQPQTAPDPSQQQAAAAPQAAPAPQAAAASPFSGRHRAHVSVSVSSF